MSKVLPKILLCAGIFYPDVGGPAIHVVKIAERLRQENFEPIVLVYGDDPENKDLGFKVKRISRKHNKIFQWILYFLHAFQFARSASVVYAFDPTAAGLPARVVSQMLRKPFLIRIGGDPIWEREAELGRRVMPITDYYEQGLYKKDKPLLYKIIRYVINGADAVIFYNQFWKVFYNKYFHLPLQKIHIIKNPIFRRENASPEISDNPAIIFAGRFVTYKNLPRVMRAFSNVRECIGAGKLLVIGKGPEEEKLLELRKDLANGKYIEFLPSLPQTELFKKIRESAISIGPALSEFNPNFILESLSLGKPVLLSKGHGLSVDLPEEFLFDPLNQEELEKKMEFLLSKENYRNAVETINKIDMSQTWEKVTDFHLNLVKEFMKLDKDQIVKKFNTPTRIINE